MQVADKAPVDPTAVECSLAPFGRSMTLPASAYTSSDIFSWEQRHFFENSWTCVGREGDLPAQGDQRASQAGSNTILLVRDTGNELRAFFNVCRHRGHELLASGQTTRSAAIVCPYHAWTYALNGSLKGAPGFKNDSTFDREDYPLVPARLEEWRGWLFVNVSGAAVDLGEHVGGLKELVRDYEPARLITAARRSYFVEANWKLIAENYHECYHCSSLHPELCDVSPPNSGTNLEPDGAWIGGSMELRDEAATMSLTGESHGPPLRGLSANDRRRVLYFGLFPNLLLSLHPDYVMTHRLEPLSPHRTAIECEWLFSPEAVEQEAFDPSYARDFWDIVNEQDWRACESVQRGLSSRGQRPGPLSPREDAVYQFIKMVARSYLEGRFTAPGQS